MASAFGHAAAAITLGAFYKKKLRNWKFWILGIVCSIWPDADVLTFSFGIPYESFWGHRSFSHSLLFAALTGILVTILFYRKKLFNLSGLAYFSYFTLCTASHSLLDAMTSGGLGVAFFSPWDNTRYFLPWRPIKVSPIGASNFFSEWGIMVIKSELFWIGLPCLLVLTAIWVSRRVSKKVA